jgi:hypothetical protein
MREFHRSRGFLYLLAADTSTALEEFREQRRFANVDEGIDDLDLIFAYRPLIDLQEALGDSAAVKRLCSEVETRSPDGMERFGGLIRCRE